MSTITKKELIDRIAQSTQAKNVLVKATVQNFLNEVISELANGIHWEVDYKDAEPYIDFFPEKSRWLKDMAGITDNYFLEITDDLTDEEAQAKNQKIKEAL